MNPEEEKRLKDAFNHIMNDNINQSSLWGYPASEYDEGLELNYHDDQGPVPLSHVHTDAEIETVVREFLKENKLVDASDISVSVDKSNVKLSGTVKTQEERDYIQDAVKLIHGVGEIKSEIIVKRNEGILPSDIGRNPH